MKDFVNLEKDMQKVVRIAIGDYRAAVANKSKAEIETAVNELEEAFIMCAPFNIDGVEEVRQLILSELLQ